MGAAVAKTELPRRLSSKAFQTAIHAWVSSGVSAWNSVHSADFKEGAMEADRRMDCLLPPFPCQPCSSHLFYGSHQNTDSNRAEIWDLMGTVSYRRALPNPRGWGLSGSF